MADGGVGEHDLDASERGGALGHGGALALQVADVALDGEAPHASMRVRASSRSERVASG